MNMQSDVRWSPATAFRTVIGTAAGIIIFGILAVGVSQAEVIQRTRLTTNGSSYTRSGLGWNSRGDKIAFLKQEGHKEGHGRRIWISNPDGTNAKPISPSGWTANFGWSPDGTKIVYPHAAAFRNSYDTDVFVYDVASDTSTEIASNFTWSQFEYLTGFALQEWTRDSKEFALLLGRYQFPSKKMINAWVINVETGEQRGLTNSHYTTGFMYPGSWSPYNDWFAYAAFDSEKGTAQISVCNRDGSNDYPITPNEWEIDSDPRWSPDGKWIAFTRKGEFLNGPNTIRITDLWIIDPEGRNARRLTNGSDLNTPGRMSVIRPEWTADGRYILIETLKHSSDYEKLRSIHLIDVRTGELIKVIEDNPEAEQVMKDYEDKVVRSPDGRRIAIVVQEFTIHKDEDGREWDKDKQDVLYYFDIPSRMLHEVERVRPKGDDLMLYRPNCGWNPDWSPDGNHLLVTLAGINNGLYTPDVYIYNIGP